MDPISLIVTAMVAGAAAGAKPTAEKAVKDAYEGIKAFIKRKFEKVSGDVTEVDAPSEARREVLKEDLRKAGAGEDPDLLTQAKALLEVVSKMSSKEASGIGVNLEEVKAANLEIDTVIASSHGVNVKRSEFSGDINIKNVRAGEVNDSTDPS